LTTFDQDPTIIEWINRRIDAVPWENEFGSIDQWENGPSTPTIFDGNSLQFTTPVDMYSNTQEYDKYLVFPKRNILE
jgi:hypothetical protein